MLLNRMMRRVRREENGVAIIAVVGVMAVGLLMASLILSSLIGGVAFTSATRASVQSQAAADAGVAAARAGLQKAGDCTARGSQYTPDTPIAGLDYRATVWIRNGAGAWARGCPASTAAEVRVISNGSAADGGVAGNNLGDKAHVETVFAVNPAPIVEGPSASAVFTGSGGSVSSIIVSSGNGRPGDIHILKGDFDCNSGSVIDGSIIVADGNLKITNSCTITGSVKASGKVEISAAVSIAGDVVAAGGPVDITNSTISVGGSVYAAGYANIHGTVNGSVEATGYVNIQANGRIKQSVRAGGYFSIQGRVDGNVTTPSTVSTYVKPSGLRVGGALKIGGGITTDMSGTDAAKAAWLVNNGWVGSIAFNQTGLTGPTPQVAPTTSPWVDFEYDWADWSSAFQLKTWSGACEVGSWNASTHDTYKQLANLTSPTVVDSRACSPLTFQTGTLAIKTDIAFIGKAFTLGDMKISSADGQPHKIWFLVPDGNPSHAGKDCTNGAGNITNWGSNSQIAAPIYALAYTPCTIALNNGMRWRGQLYSGAFTVSSGDSLVYMPIGIPGTDLSGGTAIDPSAPPGGLGDITSNRNRQDNGE